MFRLLSSLVGVAFLGAPAPAQVAAESERQEGFVSLFDGKSLAGWRFSDGSATAANWKGEDGVIKLAGKDRPHLASEWDFDDFDLRLEWRAMKPDYNSGLYIRSGRNVGTNQINLAKGKEGVIVGGKIDGAKGVPELQKSPLEWNEWRVVADGGNVTFWCNGRLAWEGKNLAQKRGFIGLQAEGAPMEFRNIRIKEKGYELLRVEAFKRTGAADDEISTLKADEKFELPKCANFTFRTEWKCEKGASAKFELMGDKTSAVVFGDLADSSGGTANAKANKKADRPVGDWNYMQVGKVDGKLTVWLNGEVAHSEEASKDAVGLRLIVSGGPIMFRGFRYRNNGQ